MLPPDAARPRSPDARSKPSGRDALDGLRRLLDLLRTDSRESDLGSPQPGAGPAAVAARRRCAGPGCPSSSPSAAGPAACPARWRLNAYRIVQEALTNSLKHAGPDRATVVLDYGADALDVEVRDEGPAGGRRARRRHRRPQEPSAGYGLIGMQQRVAMLGGS